LVGGTDAGGEVLAGHGLGDDHEVMGAAGGEAFGGEEGGIGQGALEGAEGGAVDGMEDAGDAGGASGEAAEDAGLTAMSMDEVGLASAEMAGEGEEGAGILGGVDGADEGRDEGPEVGDLGGEGFEGAFRTFGGAAEEADIELGELADAEDGGERVFLGAADDQSGDDMIDATGGRVGAHRGDYPPSLPLAMDSRR
jgi:hypothetical protein